MDARAARLSVLVLSPEPDVQGGVAVFTATLKAYLTRSRATSFPVGGRHDRKERFPAVMMRLLAAPLTVLRLARSRSFDVIHINPSLDCKSAVRDGLILAALRMGRFRRTLVYFHGYDVRFAERLCRFPLAREAFAWAVNGAARIMVLSPQCRDLLVRMGIDRRKIVCTRTLFDGDLLKANPRPAPARRMILFLSRFERAKGIYALVDAFARIAADFPDTDLVMAGDGPENTALRAHAASSGLSGRILFTGYVTGQEKARLLLDCTVFALPTFFPEGMPVALLEAMGAGKPVLTARAGGIEDIIHEPDNGIVLSQVNPQTVETALRHMLADAGYCLAAGARNKQYAWDRFEARGVTAEIEAAYQAIAES